MDKMKTAVQILVIVFIGVVTMNKAKAQTSDPLTVQSINDLIANNGLQATPNEKNGQERDTGQLLKEYNLEKENIFLPQKQNFQTMSEDWYEPDTITTYSTYGNPLDRYVYSYENGNCTTHMCHFFRSGQWENVWKYNYTYDDAQKKLMEVLYQTGNLDQWENTYLDIYTYDIHNNVTERLRKSWNSGQWTDSYLYIYTYDTHNNIVEGLGKSWNSGQWVTKEKYTYTYDINDNITEKMYQDLTIIYYNYKYTYTYDMHNNMTEEVYQNCEYGEWEIVYENTDTYNTFNKKIETLRKWWDHGKFTGASKWTYTYDAHNNLTEEVCQNSWTSWENDYKIVYTYNEQNNRTEYLYQEWKSAQWVNGFRYTYTYDSHNNKTEEVCQTWESGQWKNYIKWTHTYDENDNAIAGFYYMGLDDTWIDYDANLLWVYYNNMQSKKSVQRHKFTASYVKAGSVGINENRFSDNLIKLYPNPVSNILRIETNELNAISDVKIYSIQGVLLLNSKENQIDVSLLPSGIYIADINGVIRKIVKL